MTNALDRVRRTIELERALAASQRNHHVQMIRLLKEGVKTVTPHHGGWRSQCTASSCRNASAILGGIYGAKARSHRSPSG